VKDARERRLSSKTHEDHRRQGPGAKEPPLNLVGVSLAVPNYLGSAVPTACCSPAGEERLFDGQEI